MMTHSTKTTPESLDQHSRLPAVLSAALALVVGLLSGGLLLAMLGMHHAWLQGPLSVAIAAVLYRQLPRRTGEAPLSPRVIAALVAVIAVVITSNYLLRSELVIAGRDAATYANTASFLVDGSDLFPTAIAEPFVGADLDFSAPGFVVRDDGTFWQQFLHSTSTVYAFFGELFGRSAMFGVNPFLSGLAVLALFALARRFVTPGWALLAATATAASLPFAYYSRGTFSEMTTLILAVGGVWAAHVALTEDPRAALGAGVLLGASTMVRVDAWMLGVALGLLLVTTIWLDEDAAAPARQMFNGFAITAAAGLIDLAFFAEPYMALLGRRMVLLVAAAVVLRLIAPLFAGATAQRVAAAVARYRPRAVTAVTIVILAGAAYLWLVRPLLAPPLSAGVYGLEAIQLREGIAIEPNRTYGEQSTSWMVWYLGIPMVIAGLVGTIAAARRCLAPGTAATRFALLAFLTPAAVYLWRPAINPDHIWAIRRFLPMVIPGIVILAVAVTAHAVSRFAGSARNRFVAAAAVGVSLLPILITSAPLIDDADRAGLETQWVAVCDSLGGAESVLVVNDDPELPLLWRIGPPLRSWCRVSVAGIDADPGASLPSADVFIAAREDLLPAGEGQRRELSATAWQSRLTGPPNELEARSLTLWISGP